MRRSTKRRTYGKAAIASALRSARNELVTALGQYSDVEPPEVEAMRRVAANLTNALKAYDIYGMQGKRLRAALVELRELVDQRLAEVMGLVITPEERLLAKHREPTAPILTAATQEEISPAPPAAPKTAKPSPPKKQAPRNATAKSKKVRSGTRSNRKAGSRKTVPAKRSARRRRPAVRSNSGGAVKGKAGDRKTPAHS